MTKSQEQPTAEAPWQPSPVTAWVVREGWRIRNPRKLADEVCARLLAEGVPIWRFTTHIPTLHPELFGDSYRWYRDKGKATYFAAGRAVMKESDFKQSPLHAVVRSRQMLRRRLCDPATPRDYPLLEELAAQGCTDYVVLPFEFNDGSLGFVTFGSDYETGFGDSDIKTLKDLALVLARPAEILAIRTVAARLLDTYVGHDAGDRILHGQILRGSGETIEAAIWLCDLAAFTALSDNLAREDLIDLLNGYFDRMAGPVQAAGGEILKFIGDAMLAIFPLKESGSRSDAAEAAFGAAIAAVDEMSTFNRARREAGKPAPDFGISLHIGDVMYGNIGSTNRLDFTVIGPSVNLANRMQGIARLTGRPVVASAAFHDALGATGRLDSLGEHKLKGMKSAVSLFGWSPA